MHGRGNGKKCTYVIHELKNEKENIRTKEEKKKMQKGKNKTVLHFQCNSF